METSAKSAENVSESFITMTKEIIATNVEKEKAISKPGNIEFMSVYNNLEKKVLLNSDNSKDLRAKEGYILFLFQINFYFVYIDVARGLLLSVINYCIRFYKNKNIIHTYIL